MVESLSGRISSSMPSSACVASTSSWCWQSLPMAASWQRCSAASRLGLLILLGAFTVLLAQVFWLVDARSRQLLELTITALKEMEAEFPESHRLFAADALGQSRVISYTFAIRALLLAQMGFGLGVFAYGLYQ